MRSRDCVRKSGAERVAAQMALVDVHCVFLSDAVVPYRVGRGHASSWIRTIPAAFARISDMSVGEFRDWLLSDEADTKTLRALGPALHRKWSPRSANLCACKDLIAIASKCRTITQFRNTIGLQGRLSTRLQPNHPTDDPAGIAVSIVDGLMYGAGDASSVSIRLGQWKRS